MCWHADVQYAGDILLQHKEHAELLQSYDERRDAAVRFIQQVRPGLHVQTAALRDPKVCHFVHIYIGCVVSCLCKAGAVAFLILLACALLTSMNCPANVLYLRFYKTSCYPHAAPYCCLHTKGVTYVEILYLLLWTSCCWMQEPTGAATISEMEAIVVSKETVKGANDINAWRHEHGSVPLTVVTVDLVGSQGSDTASKLSSTRLRHDEASRPAGAWLEMPICTQSPDLFYQMPEVHLFVIQHIKLYDHEDVSADVYRHIDTMW